MKTVFTIILICFMVLGLKAQKYSLGTIGSFSYEQANFVGDAKDYASDGEVFIYNTSGTLQKQFSVGLIPNGFYFND